MNGQGYGIFRWVDDQGRTNQLQGLRKEGTNEVLGIGVGSLGRGYVTVPNGAEVYRPKRPKMVLAGYLFDGEVKEENR